MSKFKYILLLGTIIASHQSLSQDGTWKFLVNNSKPIFKIDFSEEEARNLRESQPVKSKYYEVASSNFSRSFFSLTLEELGNRQYTNMVKSSNHKLTCFLTEDHWDNLDVKALDVSLSQLDSRMSFVFKRQIYDEGKPITFPVPLPFKLNRESRSPNTYHRDIVLGNEYFMNTINRNNRGEIVFDEKISVKFLNHEEGPSSVNIYRAGFTDYDLCYTP